MDFVTREEFEALGKRVVELESKIAPEKETIYMRPPFLDDPIVDDPKVQDASGPLILDDEEA